MDTQTWAVIASLVAAGSYLLFHSWRAWKRIRSGGCSSSCGCEAKPQQAKQPGFVQVQDLTARLRERLK